MTLGDVLERVIADGIEAAKADYTDPEDEQRLEGSIAGFEACEGKSPSELRKLLAEAHGKTREAWVRAHMNAPMDRSDADTENYWYWRCYELEVGWVCNVLSVVLVNEGARPIVPPTARAAIKAAEIVGVAEQNGRAQ